MIKTNSTLEGRFRFYTILVIVVLGVCGGISYSLVQHFNTQQFERAIKRQVITEHVHQLRNISHLLEKELQRYLLLPDKEQVKQLPELMLSFNQTITRLKRIKWNTSSADYDEDLSTCAAVAEEAHRERRVQGGRPASQRRVLLP